jgi:hypothetical protein
MNDEKKQQQQMYRVIFVNQSQVYELYAQEIYQSDLYGFVEVEGIVFGERAQLVVDPGEERLKNEFSGVSRSFVPIHAIIRIDEVEKEGIAKVIEVKSGNVTPFPHFPIGGGPGKSSK